MADRKRLVMLLLNPCTHDTRVMKEAMSLTNHGFEVHIVALMKPGLEPVQDVDGITIHRIKPTLIRPSNLMIATQVMLSGARHIPRISREPKDRSMFMRICAWFTDLVQLICRILLKCLMLVVIILAFVPLQVAMCVKQKRMPLKISREEILVVLHAIMKRIWNRIIVSLPYTLRFHSINMDMAVHAIRLSPDIMQSHDCNTLLGGVVVKKSLGTPLIYDSHELYLERNIGNRARWWDKFQWAPIERQYIRHCDAVLTVSKGIVEHLNTQYGRNDVALVRNVQPYHPAPPRNTLLRDELGISPDRKIALYIGAITFNRGVEELIEAAEVLEHSAIVIMGPAIDSTYLDRLKAQASANGTLDRTIFFRGPVDSSQVLEYCASTDIGVVPTQACCLSYEFESSNKIFHCVMAGRPLAMSNHIEKRLLAEEYGIGRLFDETDPADIARVIDEMVMDAAGMKSMSKHCLEAAKALCWEEDERRVVELFRKFAFE